MLHHGNRVRRQGGKEAVRHVDDNYFDSLPVPAKCERRPFGASLWRRRERADDGSDPMVAEHEQHGDLAITGRPDSSDTNGAAGKEGSLPRLTPFRALRRRADQPTNCC